MERKMDDINPIVFEFTPTEEARKLFELRESYKCTAKLNYEISKILGRDRANSSVVVGSNWWGGDDVKCHINLGRPDHKIIAIGKS
jgi:hypothetical protein